MNAEENVQKIRDAYQLWNDSRADSIGQWLDLFADDVQFKSIADGAPGMEFTKTRNSKQDLIGYFTDLASEWSMIHFTADEFVADGDRVIMIGNCGWKHQRTGKEVETPKVDIMRLKDGKIIEFFELYDTAKAIAAATD